MPGSSRGRRSLSLGDVRHHDDRVSDVHRVFQEFADGTSMHGVPRIINARSIPGRFCWSVICMGAFGMFLWQCGILLERYYSYPKKVMVEIVQRPVPFPAVSLCNTDFLDLEVAHHLKETLIQSNGTFMPTEKQAKFIERYFDFFLYSFHLLSVYQEITQDKNKLQQDMAEVYSRLGLVANLGHQLSSTGSIQLDNFIVSCRFMDGLCNVTTAFDKIFDPYFFNCFTFQPNTILKSRASRLQGVEYGLTVLLFTKSAGQVGMDREDAEELTFIPGLQESDSALASGQGVRLVIHPPNTRPHLTADGYDIPPGFSVTIGVKARENVRIRHPHGNCSSMKNVPHVEEETSEYTQPNYQYTLMDCQNECIQRTIMETCSCVDNRINMVENPRHLPFCFKVPRVSEKCRNNTMRALVTKTQSQDDEKCFKPIRAFSRRMECRKEVYENMTIRDPDSMNKCECYPPCNDIIYDSSYSLSMLPERSPAHSQFYASVVRFVEDLPEPRRMLLENSLGKDYKDILINRTIRLNVHISDSNIIKTTESPDYEAIRLISDIGGQLGLWIGISVMTIFEVLQLVADIFRFLTGKSRNVGELRNRAIDDNFRNHRYGNGDQGYIRPSHLDLENCEIDKLTTV
ncbi:hypothetical protein CAPTEDRAFT_185559 [Capitella teleta]|uniref:Uncharacterized protein n=1 Tax=Capitella teleta TaxID=283909 RepID=R7VA64_CAPTE|nr:hypothetical protein CAPTEDRAFT_185559 [Capitella teleta]|eukprot:ELU12615.1 hypothetical protein CAPTEDRAFT_185559 [Capitella teleta]